MSLAAPDSNALVYGSKMAAKVDSALIQDGFQIYHHTFFFTLRQAQGKPQISWTVVQQGMNTKSQTARRYHWHSKSVKYLINEPHSCIVSQLKFKNVLNLTAGESDKNREISTELVSQNFNTLMKDIKLISRHQTPLSQMVEFESQGRQLKLLNLEPVEFYSHPVEAEDFYQSRYLQKILWELCDQKPETYEKMVAMRGVGPKTVRALALVAEVIYGAKPSYSDPARYSFAHGGKDATPYPIDRPIYDHTIRKMAEYVRKTSLPLLEKQRIIRDLKPQNI